MFCLIADLNSLNLVLINADIELIKSSFRGDLVPFFVYIDCPCFHWGGGQGGGSGEDFQEAHMYTLDGIDTQFTSKWTGSDIVKENLLIITKNAENLKFL